MSNNSLERFIGGPPAWVLGRLLMLSLLVGVVLWVFDIRPWNVFWRIKAFLMSIVDNFADFAHLILEWLMVGLVVVVPLWFISRLFAAKPPAPPMA